MMVDCCECSRRQLSVVSGQRKHPLSQKEIDGPAPRDLKNVSSKERVAALLYQ
jgi:hypothetical protein